MYVGICVFRVHNFRLFYMQLYEQISKTNVKIPVTKDSTLDVLCKRKLKHRREQNTFCSAQEICSNLELSLAEKYQFNTSLPSATVVAERLCFHRCLCPQGGCVHPWADTPPGQPPPVQIPSWADTPLGRYPPGRHPTPLGRHPPYRRPLQRTVHILLECILVLYNFAFK